MRIALMADIHANREAFEACLVHARRHGAERYVFLGDHVGYNADPAWTLATIMDLVGKGAMALHGNHDRAIAEPSERMNADAVAAIAWTRGQLGDGARRFLEDLPMQIEDEDRLYVHAEVPVGTRWRYVLGAGDAERCLKATTAKYAFCGHVHLPALYGVAPLGRTATFRPMDGVAVGLTARRRWFAVLGSVGQPRDGNPAAAYSMLDTARRELTCHRVPYDIAATADKIRRAGLPEALARRLAQGR